MRPEDKKYILENMNKKSAQRIAQELILKERKVRQVIENERAKNAAKGKERSPEAVINRKALYVSAALIALLGIIVYVNSLTGQFVLDDYHLIKDNVYIKNWSKLINAFTESIGSGAGREYTFYRPLQTLTYMFDYSLWRLNVVGYHIASVLLHILASLCVFWLIRLIFKNNVLGLFTAILFVVHPLHTEAVSYIAGRADPLVLIFMMLTFVFYLKTLEDDNIRLYALTFISYILALISRENSLILVFLILLYHMTFKTRPNYKALIPLGILAVIYIIARVTVLKGLLAQASPAPGFLQRLPGSLVALATYARLLILPFGLHMEYGGKLFPYNYPTVYAGLAILILSLTYAFRKKGSSIIFFSIMWFYIALIPVSNTIYPINGYIAEHWLYLPSIGFFLLVSSYLTKLYENENFKRLALALAILITGYFSVRTIQQNSYWHDAAGFYSRTITFSPDNAMMYSDLGFELFKMGRKEEAIDAFKKATQADPTYSGAYNNLGNALNSIGRKEEAIAVYKRAMEVDPRSVYAYVNLGNIYRGMGNKEEAVALLKRAIEVNPKHVDAYNNLGIAYFDMGKYDEAVAAYYKAIERNPKYAEAYNNLGILYYNTNRNKEAIDEFKRSIEINPAQGDAQANLATAYFYEKEYDLALRHCEIALSLGHKVNSELLQVLAPYRKR